MAMEMSVFRRSVAFKLGWNTETLFRWPGGHTRQDRHTRAKRKGTRRAQWTPKDGHLPKPTFAKGDVCGHL